MSIKFGIAALIFALLFLALGYFVTHTPLSRLDVESVALRGGAQPLAIAFTLTGYPLILTILSVLAVATALVMRVSIAIPATIAISQTLSQGLVNVAKGVYTRARPDDWLYRHEAGFSYPSGHASTAIVFYGAWLAVLAFSPLPLRVRIAGCTVLAIWSFGIMWSRMALGAHYPTDVIGGVLLGAAWMCTLVALISAVAPGALTIAR